MNTWLGLHSNWNEANATYVYGGEKPLGGLKWVYNGKGNKGKAREKGLGQVQHGNHPQQA